MSQTISLAPEQLFSDPADVIDWLQTLDPDGGAGVSSKSDDCTLSRYARARLGNGYVVGVGSNIYSIAESEVISAYGVLSPWVSRTVFATPKWAGRFIAWHDASAFPGHMVSVSQAIAMLKRVVADLAAEALTADSTADQAHLSPAFTQPPLWGWESVPTPGVSALSPFTATNTWSWSLSPVTEQVLV